MVDGPEGSMEAYADWHPKTTAPAPAGEKGGNMLGQASTETSAGNVDTRTPNFLDGVTKVSVGPDRMEGNLPIAQPFHPEPSAEQNWPDTKGAKLVIDGLAEAGEVSRLETLQIAEPEQRDLVDNEKLAENFQGLPQSEDQLIERFNKMGDAEKVQTVRDGLVGMIADENLPREQRDLYEALIKEDDKTILAYANAEMDRRSVDIRQSTALVPYVAEEAQQLVNEGVITQEQADTAQHTVAGLLTDGKGPKNKEGIRSILLESALNLGEYFKLDFNGFVNAIFSAMAGK